MVAYNVKRCGRCGTDNDRNATFCRECGFRFIVPFYKKWWFWFIPFIILFFSAGTLRNKVEQNYSTTTSVKIISTTAKPTTITTTSAPIVVTAEEMLDLLDENALKAEKTYNDLYIEVTGRLYNIDSDGEYFSIGRIDDDYSFLDIMCYIDEKFVDEVLEFKIDQTVTVVGRVKSVGEVMGYSLDVERIK